MATHNSGKWTDGRYKSFITSSLRSAMRRWPPKWEALKDAYVGQQVNKKTKRLAKHFQCAICGGKFTSTNIQIDHKVPLGNCKSWDEFIEKLFCEKENLQVACKPCHKKKTKEENEDRKHSHK